MSHFSRFPISLIYIVIYFICCNTVSVEWNIQSKTDSDLLPKCRFGNHSMLYPANEVWKYLTGYECYYYRNTERLNYILEPQLTALGNYTIPYVVYNGTSIFFDFEDSVYLDLIRPLFKSEWFYNLWKQCSESAVECCEKHLNETNVYPTEEYVCSALWDGLDCWLPEISGEIAKKTCPRYISDVVCLLESEKYCLNDEWSHTTNYEKCAASPMLRRRHQFRIATLIVPLLFAFPALIIYLILWVKRIYCYNLANRNFIIAIVLKNIFTLICTTVIILDYLQPEEVSNGVMNNNGIGCKLLAMLNYYFNAAVFTSMLVTCLYLHDRIISTKSETQNYKNMNIITIILPLIPTVPLALISGIIGVDNCWLMNPYGLHWLLDIYIYIVFAGNLTLFFDLITRIIWPNKLNDNTQQAKTISCTIAILTLLFGIPFGFTSQSYLIDQNNCLYRDIYYYIFYIIEASQGVVVTLLFCYLDNNVYSNLKKCIFGSEKSPQTSN